MLEICNEECCIILDINVLVVLDVCMSGSLILHLKCFFKFIFLFNVIAHRVCILLD